VKTQRRRGSECAPIAIFAFALLAAGVAHAAGDELVLLPDLTKLLILIALFTALVFPMNKLVFRPIFRVLDAREEKTAGTRRHADKLAVDAQQMLERYEDSIRTVRQEAEDARKQAIASARSDGGAATAAARTEAEGEVARAREEIATALEQARATLKAQSAALANEVAERALGRTLS